MANKRKIAQSIPQAVSPNPLPNPAVDDFMTVREWCETGKFSERKGRELIARRTIPFYRIDGSIRISRSEWRDYLKAQCRVAPLSELTTQ